MINVFFNTDYIKPKTVFLTKSFRFSKFYSLYLTIYSLLNLPINEKFIYSGPHKRMNNALKTFKNNPEYSINKKVYENSYILQFDKFGQNILNKLLNDNNNSFILVGPLFSIKEERLLNKIINENKNVKKLVASEIAKKNTVEMDKNFDLSKCVVCPSGVVQKKEVAKSLEIKNRNNRCLVYYKKRPKEHLDKIISILSEHGIEFDLFEYGKYDNHQLKKIAKQNKFGIILSRPETQGFGIQELMSCNLPLFVWDQNINYYENFEISGTTVSTWGNNCGVVESNEKKLNISFNKFLDEIDRYNPAELVLEKLTFEKFRENLQRLFLEFNSED